MILGARGGTWLSSWLRAMLHGVSTSRVRALAALALMVSLWTAPAAALADVKTLMVGSETDFPPYADVDERGGATGFSVELFSAVAAAMNIPVHYEVGTWDAAWHGLLANKLDALPIVARVKSREALVEHTSVHTVGYDSFVVRKGSPKIASLADAKGKRIIVMRSDAAHHQLDQRGFGQDLVFAATLPEALRVLAGGQHDALLAPLVQVTRLVRSLGLKEVEVGPPLNEYSREFTFAVSKGNTALRDQLEQGLLVVKANGEYQRIYDRWLGIYEPRPVLLTTQLYAAGGTAVVLLLGSAWIWSLRRSRARLDQLVREQQAILDCQVAGIAKVVADRCEWISPTFAKMLGYAPQELLGQSTRIIYLSDEEYLRTAKDTSRAVAAAGMYRGEVQFRRKDGSLGWFDLCGTLIGERSDTLMWSCIDLTERKLSEVALLENEQHFRNLADNGSALIWTSGPDKRCDYFNKPWLHFTGRTLEQELGDGWSEGVHPGDLARCLDIYIKAFDARQPFSMNYRLHHASGDYRWIRDDGVPRFDQSGAFLGYIGHCYDIDEAVKLRVQAEDSERQYQAILEGSPEGVVTAEVSTRRFVAANQAMCALLGYERAELLALETLDIHPPDARTLILELFSQMARGERTEASSVPFRRKNGEVVYADIVVCLHHFGGTLCLTGFFRDITEKRRTEAKMRQLSLAVEQSPDSIIITDLDARIEYANEGFCRNSGYSVGEVLGRNPRFLASGSTPRETFAEMWAALNAGHSWVGTLFNRTRQGSLMTDRAIISPLRDEDGRVTHFVAVQTDITEQESLLAILNQQQRALEQLVAQRTSELEQQKQFLEDLIGTLPIGVYRLRHRTAATAVQWGDLDHPPHFQEFSSDAYCALLGISREEAAATQGGVISRIHPADRDEFLRRVEVSNFTMTPFSWEGRMLVRGETRWMRFDSIPRRVGDEIVVSGILQNVEEQRRLGSLIYRSVVEASPDAFVAIDEGNRVIEWSAQAEGMFGYAADEVIGMSLTDVMIPASHAGEHEYHLREFVASGGQGVTRKRRRAIAKRRDGTEFPVELQIMALLIDGHWRFTSFVRDISDAVAAEQRLVQAQKLEAIGQLTGGLAHDFNNLLGIVAGNLDLLREGSSPEEAAELIDAALQAARRGVGVTKSLLALARRDKLAAGATNLNVLIGEIEPLLRQSAGRRINVSIAARAKDATAIVDANAFTNALINLVLNARDAMPTGGDMLVYAVSTYLEAAGAGEALRPDLPEGLYVVVGVDDTGHGMTPEVLRRATDPFYTTKRRDTGTGLGLAMVNAFAAQSGGALHLESTPGKGTSARLMLPVATLPEMPATAPRAPADQPATTELRRILVVDDEAGLLRIYEKWLTGLGYSVVAASSAAEALKVLADGEFDVLLSDIVMPGEMDGLALARHTARLYPEVKVVLASGYPENITDDDKRRWTVLEKPVSREQVAGAVAQALRHRTQVRP